jgi:hypothetical protein
MTYFELDPCTNCRSNCWSLGLRKKLHTEFKCFYCGQVRDVILTKEQYLHLMGDN